MIVPTIARLLARAHLRGPLSGRLLTLGRQTIALTVEQALELLRQEGVTVREPDAGEMGPLLDARTRHGKGVNYISDAAFFRLLGVRELSILDVSDYEGADITHNLNEPVPPSLHEQFDFIIDGGTFDHLFDLRVAFENIVRMLRPGGRVLQWNAASNFTGAAYMSFGPDLFYDYYVGNGFVNCEVYIVEVDSIAQPELWSFYRWEGSDQSSHFQSNNVQMVVVFAEKGTSSSWDKIPIQSHYREPHVRDLNRLAQGRMVSLSVEPLVNSDSSRRLRTPSSGKRIGDSVSYLVKRTEELGVAEAFRRGVLRVVDRVRRALGIKGRRIRGYRYVGKV